MKDLRLAPAMFFIASVVGSLGAPRPLNAACATGPSAQRLQCCDTSFSVDEYTCDLIGRLLVVTGSRTVCDCGTERIVLETVTFGSTSCSCE